MKWMKAADAAFEAELARLPKGAQNTIRDAMSRDESLSWAMFLAGWRAGADELKRALHQFQPSSLRGMVGDVLIDHDEAELFPRNWTTTERNL